MPSCVFEIQIEERLVALGLPIGPCPPPLRAVKRLIECPSVSSEAACVAAANASAQSYTATAGCVGGPTYFSHLGSVLAVKWMPCNSCCSTFGMPCGSFEVKCGICEDITLEAPICGGACQPGQSPAYTSRVFIAECDPHACCKPPYPNQTGECVSTNDQTCCQTTLGGTYRANRRCSETPGPCEVGLVGCCLCDRCEDMTASACANRGGTPMSGSCDSAATRESCRLADTKRPCVRGTWQFARRPPQHPPVGITVRPGRWEPCSVNKQRTLDRAGGSYTEPTECRYSYGYVQRSPTQGRWDGKFCNTYNSNCPSGIRRRQTLRLVRNGNRWEWQGRYRPPCPEVTDWPLSTAVGCPP